MAVQTAPKSSGRTRAVAFLLMLAALVVGELAAAQAPPSAGATQPAEGPNAGPRRSWTAESIDEMVDQQIRLAQQAGPDAIARLVVAASLHSVASAGHAVRGLSSFHSSSAALDDQAHWLARTLEPRPVSSNTLDALAAPATVARSLSGLVTAFAVLGPFEDNGGGLDRAEGPESASHHYLSADYSWGAHRVRYGAAVPSLVGAQGLDLDLYVHPRKETCTYLESVVRFPLLAPGQGAPRAPGSSRVLLHVASSGAFRILWDGQPVLRSGESHAAARLDRASASVQAGPSDHHLVVKVCTGAIVEAGTIRIRFTDEQYEPVAVESSSDLGRIDRVASRARRGAADGAPTSLMAEDTTSPLGKALLVGEPQDPGAWLAAALLRTLGGADDLQSPRAPGLLDAVVASPNVRADELAMAGWSSPSPANRSGWLERARTVARNTGDHATAAFAQRMLVEVRLVSGQTDLARGTLGEAPLSDARDAHVRLLRARAIASAGGTGLRASALAQLITLTAEQKDTTPLAVWHAVATLAQGSRPELRRDALERVLASDPDASGLAWAQTLAPFSAEDATTAALGELGRVRSNRDVTDVAKLLRDLGQYDLARRTYRAAARLAPNASTAAVGLARAELESSRAPEAQQRAQRALSRALELEPQRAALSAEIDFRAGTAGDEASRPAADDLGYLVEPHVFLARARTSPARVGAQFERVLHWRRVVRLHPDKRVSQLMHWAREIVVEPRTEAERYEDLYVGASRVELVLARVHRRDGTVVPPEEQETPSIGVPTVRWPKLERGDVVEIAVRAWTDGPVNRRGDVPFYFVDYVGSLDTRPVLYNEVVIDAPVGGPLAFDVLHGRPDRTEQSVHEGRRVTRLVWDSPPVIADEPLAPPPSELLPVVVGSAYPSWAAFAAWYQGAVEGFTEPDEQIRRLADELTQPTKGGNLSRDEKIRALFEFVADDIRYVNFVSGEWWLPNRPQQLLARRQGDCDDKAMLLISLLRAVGIDAVEALVQTRHTGQPSILRDASVAIPMFDHGIVYVPATETTPHLWLDATSPESRMGALPSMDLGATALWIAPTSRPSVEATDDAAASVGAVRIVDIPPGRASDHGVDARWTIRLEPSGDGAIDAVERHVGDAGLLLRTYLRQPDARAPWVEQELLGGWFSSVELDPDVGFDADRPGGEAEVRFRGRSRDVARREGEDSIVTLAPRMPLTASLAPLPHRTLPVVLPPSVAPRHHRLEVRLEAPRALRFADLPPDAVEDGGSFGRAEVTFSRSGERGRAGGEVVIMRREIAFEDTRIDLARYEAWRRWLQRIDAMVQLGLRLTPR